MSDKPSRPFFDSCVLLYALSQDDPRAAVAEELLAAGGVVSVQVLNEFAAVARRKLNMPWPEVQEALAAVRALCEPPVPVSLQVHETAIEIAARSGYQIYDAAILAAALQAGCDVLYTEDMQHGRRIESLTIQNPFPQPLR
jgi:predicted nucleic acid-binding protein